LKLQVSFAKEPYKRDDILQKRPIFLRSLLTIATPQYVCLAEVSFIVILYSASRSELAFENVYQCYFLILL